MTLRVGTATAMAVAYLLLTAGCGNDDPVPSPTPGASTESPGSPEPTVTTSGPTQTTEPTNGPAPAIGPLLVGYSSQVRAPQGWRKRKGMTSYVHPADRPGPSDHLQLYDHVSIVDDSTTLEELVESFRDLKPEETRIKRLPDVNLDGTMAYHLRWTTPGYPVINHALGTVRNGRSIGLDVQLSNRTSRTEPDLIESILLTFEWR